LALSVLSWVLDDSQRAERLLGLTGLTPDALRSGLGDSAVLCAVLEFVAGHEPDLLAAAEALGVRPAQLVAAANGLGA
jgi:adenine/guanine phosphoribosyltransferase-like PRPP-binding protein